MYTITTRKTLIFVITIGLISLFLASCGNPTGPDTKRPVVRITNFQNGDNVTNAVESVMINVEATDSGGIEKTNLICNGLVLTSNNEPHDFIIQTEYLFDMNFIYAVAFDNSDNTAQTDSIFFQYVNTLIVEDPIEDINLMDIENQLFIDLDNHFSDTLYPDNALEFELISNSNPSIASVHLMGNILGIDPIQYSYGSSAVTLRISAGDHRILNYSFSFNIIQFEPMYKVYVPDDQFREVLFYDYGFTEFAGEDSISGDEAEAIVKLELTTNSINSVEGLQAFVNLDSLRIEEPIEYLNLISNIGLKYLSVSETDLSELNIHFLSQLEYLLLLYNINLNVVDLSYNIDLNYLGIDVCLNQLDVSNNINLEKLEIGDSNIQSLDLSNNIAIEEAYVSWCPDLVQLIFPENSALSNFRISYCDNLMSFNLSYLTLLTNLIIKYSGVSSLDISNNTVLEYIDLRNNVNLVETFVWQLPLPDYVSLYKDDHNILYVP